MGYVLRTDFMLKPNTLPTLKDHRAFKYMTIYVRSHHFLVRTFEPLGREICGILSRQLIQFKVFKTKWGDMKREATKVFASSNASRTEFRYHINLLPEFKLILQNRIRDPKLYDFVYEPEYTPDSVSFTIQPQWSDRDYQIPIIEYLASSPVRRRFLSLQTGRGKSYCAMRACAILGQRVAIFVLPKYADKWAKDIQRTYECGKNDILIIAGSKGLKDLLRLRALGKMEAKILIFSIPTVREWYGLYEKYGKAIKDLGYECIPEDLLKFLGVGVRITDEAHEHFHANTKVDFYTHCPVSIGLSATLFNLDQFTERMYRIMYPPSERCPELELIRYIDAFSVSYRWKYPEEIKISETGQSMYSNNAVEYWTLKHPKLLKGWLEYVVWIVEHGYAKSKRKNRKMLLYFWRGDMIDAVVKCLEGKYPDRKVQKYMSEETLDQLLDCDIGVTTYGSAGAALDIPDLTDVAMFVGIRSQQYLVQLSGRLRELKTPGEDNQTRFYYAVCLNQEKSMSFHASNYELLKLRAKTVNCLDSGIVIG
jgi:hypothetical protein